MGVGQLSGPYRSPDVMPVEVPLELLGLVALLPALGMAFSCLCGGCCLTERVFGVPTPEKSPMAPPIILSSGAERSAQSQRRGRWAMATIVGLFGWQYVTYLFQIWPSGLAQPGLLVCK